MRINDIMRRGAITTLESDTLSAALRVMQRARIRHLPVIGNGRLSGMLSERDILAARARAEGNEPWWTIPVWRVMSAPVQTASPDDEVADVAGRLAAGKIGAMPIVAQGQLLGIVTRSDLLDAEVRAAAVAPSKISAADVMTPFPHAVQLDALLADAVAIMLEHHVRHIPVIDPKESIVGMLSDRDVRTAVGDPVRYVEERTRTTAPLHVRDVMVAEATIVPFDTPLLELARRFADERIGALPVVDRFGALIGIVSYVDALRVLARG